MKQFGHTILLAALLTAWCCFAVQPQTAAAASDDWQWLKPAPQGNHLLDADFVDATTGWAVGDEGSVLRTANSGATWLPQESGVTWNLKAVDFVSANVGWVGGDAGTILKTTNGGQDWVSQSLPTSSRVMDICFIDANFGWAAVYGTLGSYNYGIFKTTDGGQTWVKTSSVDTNLWCLQFIDASTGWAQTRESALYKTTDGGNTWVLLDGGGGVLSSACSLYMLNSTTGWRITPGLSSYIWKTTDGGATWTSRYSGQSRDLNSVRFWDANNGCAVGNYGVVVRTTDGGMSWQTVSPTNDGALNTVRYLSSSVSVAVGNFGKICSTTNGGVNWSIVDPSSRGAFRAISFADSSTGWVCGSDVYDSPRYVVKTGDSGATWTNQVYGSFYGVDCVNPSTAWVVGSSGDIRRTVDGGNTWSTQASGTNTVLNDVDLVNSSSGWAVGGNGVIIRTANGGTSWTTQLSNTSQTLESISAVDSSNAWAVGASGVIVRTSDGGATWAAQQSGITGALSSVDFVNLDSGWAVGAGGVVLHTSNGGATWVAQASGITRALNDVDFITPQVGRAVSTYGVLATVDGGTTWRLQRPNTMNSLNAVQMTSVGQAYSAGDGGSILRWRDTIRPNVAAVVQSPYQGSAQIDISAEDTGSGIAEFAYRIDGGAITTVTATADVATCSSLGPHTLELRALDGAGNLAPWRAWEFAIVDGTAPVTTCNPASTYTDSASILLSATDGGTGVTHVAYQLDESAVTTVAGSAATIQCSTLGPHTLRVRARDAADNVSAWATRDFSVVDGTALTIARSSASPAYNTAVTLSATLSRAGQGTAIKNGTVTFYRLNGTTWVYVGGANTGETGTAVLAIKPYLANKTVYSARFAGQTNYYTGATSASTYVLPRVYLTNPSAPTSARRSVAFTVSGYLRPLHSAGTYPVRIYKDRWSSGRWAAAGSVNAKAITSNGSTRYTASIALPSAGRWRLRAYAPADTQHSATWSTGYASIAVQ